MFLARLTTIVTLSLAFSHAVFAADLTVTTNADGGDSNPGDGVCSTFSGGCSFRAAVQESNALAGADSIYFEFASVPTAITLQLGEVLISDNVTVSGSKFPSDVRLVGNGASRVISIVRGGISVIIRGVTITNGATTGSNNGGGIYVATANLTLENVVIRNNISGASGGGVYSGTGVFRFMNSTAADNLAKGNGGGGGLSVQGNNSVIQRSNIVGNQAPRGGGIEVSGGTTTINDTTIDNNYTNGGGAGLLAVFGTANINRSTISNNTAFRSGGGIALPYGTVTLVNSTVSGNTVTNGGGGGINTGENGSIGYLTVHNSTIVNNTSLYSGGVTGGYAAGVRIGNSILSANVALTGPNINSQFTSLGGNLVSDRAGSMGYLETDLPDGTNPMLGPLAFNGGPTKSHALMPGSPAINTGQNGGASDLSTDQRGKGFLCLSGGIVDIGAFEVQIKDASR